MLASGGRFDADHEAYRASVRQFVRRSDHAAWDDGLPRTVLREAGDAGLLSVTLPAEHGGAGLCDGRFAFVVAQESMRPGATGLGLTLAAHGVAAEALARSADDEQRKQWLPGLAAGELLGTVADGPLLAEDGHLSGTAVDVVSGATADLVVVVLGDRLGLVPAGSPGLTVDHGAARLGVPGAGLIDLHFDGVAVELLPATDGAAVRSSELLAVAMLAVAGAETALALTISYVQSRKVFGRPLAEFENTTVTLAEVAVQLVAARALLDEAISFGAALTPADAAATALAATAAHTRAVDEGLQLHGGYGYMREYPIASAFADAGYLRLRVACGLTQQAVIAQALGL